ncbi:hypothetical protein PENTCL1PPCAC_13793, partial [Pristionchus entomophagus]
ISFRMPPVRHVPVEPPIPRVRTPGHPRRSIARPKEKDECSICICDLTEKTWVQLKPCKHFFHASCSNGWLETRDEKVDQTCPTCRDRTTHQVDERGEMSLMPFPFGKTGKPTKDVMMQHPQPATLQKLIRDTQNLVNVCCSFDTTGKSEEYVADVEARRAKLLARLGTLNVMLEEWNRGAWLPPPPVPVPPPGFDYMLLMHQQQQMLRQQQLHLLQLYQAPAGGGVARAGEPEAIRIVPGDLPRLGVIVERIVVDDAERQRNAPAPLNQQLVRPVAAVDAPAHQHANRPERPVAAVPPPPAFGMARPMPLAPSALERMMQERDAAYANRMANGPPAPAAAAVAARIVHPVLPLRAAFAAATAATLPRLFDPVALAPAAAVAANQNVGGPLAAAIAAVGVQSPSVPRAAPAAAAARPRPRQAAAVRAPPAGDEEAPGLRRSARIASQRR